MPQKKYAGIGWIAQDIVENAKENGISLTRHQAKLFLEKYEMRIINSMAEAGWTYMETVLPEFTESNNKQFKDSRTRGKGTARDTER